MVSLCRVYSSAKNIRACWVLSAAIEWLVALRFTRFTLLNPEGKV